MKINKNAWHYKLMDFFNLVPWQRTNLCSYMRGMLGSIAFTIVAGWALLMIAVLISAPLWAWAVTGTGLLFSIGLIFDGLILIGLIREFAPKDKLLFKPILESRKSKPSLVMAWIRSIHDKTCPLVEFEDNK